MKRDIVRCPFHRTRLNLSKNWIPPEGLDPKMLRYACNDCDGYWYKAPKRCRLFKKVDIQLEFGVDPELT